MTDLYPEGPTWTKTCRCGRTIERWRGDIHIICSECGASWNAAGQQLRDGWQNNASNWDEEVSDMEGYEQMEARAETYESDRLDGIYFEPEYRDE